MKFDLEKTNRFWVGAWSFIFGVIAVIILLTIISARRSDQGEAQGTKFIKSITCETKDFSYPFFTYDEAKGRNLRIIAAYDDEKLESISLQYFLYYDDSATIVGSEAHNHAAMNIAFGSDGMEADSLGASYAILNDKLKFSLYAMSDNITETAQKYFLLDGASDLKIETIQDKYAKLGIECVSN